MAFSGPPVIRVTNCTALKDDEARRSGEAVAPDVLYTDPAIRRFFAAARADGVPWAVLSDQWGLLLETDLAPWYERHPDTVTPEDEAALVRSVQAKLGPLDPGVVEFVPLRRDPHPLYERVLRASVAPERLVIASVRAEGNV